MSLNFSIDSILRHSNVESSNSTLISSGKLKQTNFLNESTSAFLLKKQLNNHPQQLTNYLTSNGTSTSTNESTSNNLLQSQLFYLNKATNNNNTALNLMDNVQPNLNGSNQNNSALAFELNQIDKLSQLSHLNVMELSRLNQLTQFRNQLTQFQSQLVVPYLSKINSLYNENTSQAATRNSTAVIGSLSEDNLNSNNGRPNSNQLNNQLSSNHHHLNSNNHKSFENSIPFSSSSIKQHQQQAAFLSLGLANGSSALFNSNSAESQCSPLSDKSCEMSLNYEDSSDRSNQTTPHSGNNVSINSNNSTITIISNSTNKHLNSLNSSNNNSLNNKDKDSPLCTKCKLHGIRNLVKGHKKNCPKKDCMCDLCILTDYGKRLRGKKIKKAAAAAAASASAAGLLSSRAQSTANLLMIDSLNEANNLTNLKNLNNLNNLSSLNSLNDNGTNLLTGSTVGCLNQSTTPNSNNSNSSCSNLSMSTALAAATLRNHQAQSTISSTPSTNSTMFNQQLTNLHSGLGFLEKSAIKDYMKIVISLLKDKLAQDGLNYEQELSKLKISVIYLLLNRFDKSELFNKFLTDA